jgi:hypothetical protein
VHRPHAAAIDKRPHAEDLVGIGVHGTSDYRSAKTITG